ncbi:hypothetical protein F6455_13990 [Proteobacteria bacterium 005FR1]|nr:hypothetical protein [Proteobacteria bacterium 005FR1]
MTDQQKTSNDAERTIQLPAEELRGIAQRIIDSGALGRSKVYARLLSYLVNCAEKGESPKEIEIAIEVLGRDADFDVSKDSAVRVYIHQLRKKLDHYYKKYEPHARYRLTIPRGQYTVEALETLESTKNETRASTEEATPPPHRRKWWPAAIAALLAMNLLAISALWLSDQGSGPSAVASHPAWARLLDDELPILVVMGDYYIFGELDEAGNVKRMIRDFDINSEQDLDNLFAAEPELGWEYYDLNLSYLPEGSAVALNDVMPVLHSSGKPVSVKMMSELTTRDLQRNHVVYVGYISALDRIRQMLFAVSDLRVGDNYDQLINKDSGQVYTSTAGLPSFDEPFVDYGWFATFPSTQNTQVVVIAGMRDAGLIHTAQALTENRSLQAIEKQLKTSKKPASAGFEAVYQVRGLDRMSFDARLEYAGYVDARQIWRDEFELVK